MDEDGEGLIIKYRKIKYTIPECSGGGEEDQMLRKVVQKIPHHKPGRCFSLISQIRGSLD
jgi:hypothetical protein